MTLKISLKTARILGIIGSALTLFLYVPGFGGILNLIGAVLLLLAVRAISKRTHDSRIFKLFIIYIVALIIIAVLTISLSGYIITHIQTGEVSISLKLLETLLTILPLVALFFFMKSYSLISEKTEVRWFSATGKVAFAIAALVAIAGLIFTFTEGTKLIAQLSTLISILGYIAVPVLGIISYVLLKPKVLEYRYNS